MERKPLFRSLEDVLGIDFVLYLRAFEEDDKSLEQQFRRSPNLHLNFNDFYEFDFISLIDNCIAVGKPGQQIPPEGADRIFFNNDEWQESVQLLIKRAIKIIVLVSDKPSCIWEILNLADYLDKTFFIIRDINIYNKVCEVLYPRLELPQDDDEEVPFMFFKKNGEYIRYNFSNTLFDYGAVVAVINAGGIDE